MNIKEVRQYVLLLPGVTEDQPFGDDIITYRVEGKIFHTDSSSASCRRLRGKNIICKNDRTPHEYGTTHYITTGYKVR